MALSLNKPKLDNLAGDIWKSAERLRGKFKAYEYQGVILPIIVIRRLECVLVAWRETKRAEVLARRPKLTEKELAKLVKELNYRVTIGTLVKNNRLAPILNQYKELPLGPDQLSGLEMGYVYEELLRRFSEQSGEEAGDHFTPREVIRLMVELLEIPIPDRHFSVYDPASGTGGMLSVAQEHLLDRASTPGEKERVEKFLTVHGHRLLADGRERQTRHRHRTLRKGIHRRQCRPGTGVPRQPPTPAKELLAEFWKLEKEAEKMLERHAP